MCSSRAPHPVCCDDRAHRARWLASSTRCAHAIGRLPFFIAAAKRAIEFLLCANGTDCAREIMLMTRRFIAACVFELGVFFHYRETG